MGVRGQKDSEVWRDGKKKCPVCKIYKDMDCFGKDKSNKFGITIYCKDCKKRLDKEYQRKNGSCFFAMTKKLYGVDKKEYEKMVIIQDGKCRICKEIDPYGKRLSVDHDHITGKVRGLLCSRCNHLLGNAKDNPSILHRAIEYLQGY